MPHTITLSPDKRILIVDYRGTIPVAERAAAWLESKPLLQESGARRILIDLLQATPAQEPISEHSAFVAMIGREPLLLASRTAFVAPPAHPINHLIEVLSDARHYPFSRFRDRRAALAWLQSDDPPTGLGNPLAPDEQPARPPERRSKS